MSLTLNNFLLRRALALLALVTTAIPVLNFETFSARAASPNAPTAGGLSLALSAEPAVVNPGDTVNVTIALTNYGSSSPHTRITDTLPSGFSYIPGTVSLSVDGVMKPIALITSRARIAITGRAGSK